MYRLLLVDDEILVREAIRDRVDWAGLGFTLTGLCEDGQEAIDFLEKNPVDVVLTDICMPYVDGLELCEYLSRKHPEVISAIFSGYGDFEYAKKAIKYHVTEYLLKPVTSEELCDTLLKIKERLDKLHHHNEMVGELKKGYKKFTRNESLITAKILSGLIRGSIAADKAGEELREFDMNLYASAYRIGIIDIDIYSDFYHASQEQKKESALMAFIVENISSEIMDKYKLGYAFLDSDGRTYLLFRTNRVREKSSEIREVCHELQSIIHEVSGLSVSIGIGSVVEEISDIALSYQSAKELLRYRFTLGSGCIIDTDCEVGQPDTHLLLEHLKKLEVAFLSKDEAKMSEELMHIIKLYQSSAMTKETTLLHLQQIIGKINEISISLNPEYQMQAAKTTQGIQEDLMKAINFKDACDIIENYLRTAFHHASKQHQSTKERKLRRALDYILANYANPNLDRNDICDYLEISINHFSSMFKEETGKTFTEVLLEVRIDKAKELLRNTKLKSYEIADKIGFGDPHYFTITFKKVTGLTPKQYAKEFV